MADIPAKPTWQDRQRLAAIIAARFLPHWPDRNTGIASDLAGWAADDILATGPDVYPRDNPIPSLDGCWTDDYRRGRVDGLEQARFATPADDELARLRKVQHAAAAVGDDAQRSEIIPRFAAVRVDLLNALRAALKEATK